MPQVDPTAIIEKQKQEERQSKKKKIARTFVFSALGALLGAALCVMLDFLFIGSVTGIFYLIVGMAACAFYHYFIQRKDQKKIHILIVVIACMLVTVLSVFVECMILHSNLVQDAGMNTFEKTIELYRQNISNNGIMSEAHQTVSGEVLYYNLSILAINITCAVMASIGFLATFGILSVVTKSWEKKHGQQNVEYGYSTRKSRPAKNSKKAKGKKHR